MTDTLQVDPPPGAPPDPPPQISVSQEVSLSSMFVFHFTHINMMH